MTVQEFYDWAVANRIENFEINVYGDAGDTYELEVANLDICETTNEIYVG